MKNTTKNSKKELYTTLLNAVRTLSECYTKDINETLQTIEAADKEGKLDRYILGSMLAHETQYLETLTNLNSAIRNSARAFTDMES